MFSEAQKLKLTLANLERKKPLFDLPNSMGGAVSAAVVDIAVLEKVGRHEMGYVIIFYCAT